MPFFKSAEVKHPEWLIQAIADQQRSFQLIVDGKLPQCLVATFAINGCRRMLRCVYGSDFTAAIALLRIAKDEIRNQIERAPIDGCAACRRLLASWADDEDNEDELPARCPNHPYKQTEVHA
jgi:hypothetical protein